MQVSYRVRTIKQLYLPLRNYAQQLYTVCVRVYIVLLYEVYSDLSKRYTDQVEVS